MASVFFLTLFLIAVPSVAFAWGPLTHVYLGSEVLYLGPLLTPAVYSLIRKFRNDFLYGNIMADTVLAKRYMPAEKNSHSWSVACEMLGSAKKSHERAFCLGYMSHLAADTVAHGTYTAGRRNIEHAYLEFRADNNIDSSYGLRMLSIGKDVQKRNDAFIEKSLDGVFLSINTNRKLFKGFVAISALNNAGLGSLREPGLRNGKAGDLKALHRESLVRMADVLKNGERSEVLKEDPLVNCKKSRLFSAYLI